MNADKQRPAWPELAGAATGVGSMPGTDPAEALAVVLGELPHLPHLPELPARGPGAGLTGRTAALLVDLPVQATSAGWRFAARPGADQRRAADLLERDLDALTAAAADYRGPLKVQVAGPWTLAATVELARSQDPALADAGAVADLTASLAEGVAAHLAEVRARVPGAEVVLQLDEPALPWVLAGGVPTASGLRRVAAVDAAVAAGVLGAVLSPASGRGLVHCCAPRVPFCVVRDAGAGGLSFDMSMLRRGDEDGLAELAEAGLVLLAGAVKTGPERGAPATPPPREIASGVIELWHRMGMPKANLAGQVVVTPACGLSGVSMAAAREVLAACREAGRIVPEMAQEGAA